MLDKITILRARTQKLNIHDLDLPKTQLLVITGKSGSA